VVRSQLQAAVREIAEVDRGASALEFVSSRRPSAIVLDVSMPDLGGLEVLARLRATPGLASLPVILHTSKVLEPDELDQVQRDQAILVEKGDDSANRLLAAVVEAVRAGGGG
jgi:CheY-like chemotaxis protein